MNGPSWVGYLRVSSDEQVEADTPENQRRDLHRMSERLGGECAGIFEDLGISGEAVRLNDRPGWKQLIQRVSAGGVHEIRVRDITRITRETGFSDLGTLHGLMRAHGLALVFANGMRFTSGDWGALSLLAIQSLGAAGQLQGQRTALDSGKRKAVHKGTPIGGPPPFGLTWSRDAGWGFDSRYAPLLAQAFELCATGHSLTEIAEILGATGTMPPGAKCWHPSWIARLLKRPIYAGRYEQKYLGEVGVATIPALIATELFDRVQASLASRRNLPMRNDDIAFMSRHLLTCATCEAKLWAQPAWGGGPGRYYCKRCSSNGTGSPYWRRSTIDERIWSVISDHVLSSDDLLEEVVEGAADDGALLAHLDAERRAVDELDRIEKSRLAIRRRALNGSMSEHEVDRDLATLAEQKRRADAALRAARRSREAAEHARRRRASVSDEVFKLRQRIAGADAKTRREILLAVVPPGIGKIVVHKDGRLDIHGVLPTVVESSPDSPAP